MLTPTSAQEGVASATPFDAPADLAWLAGIIEGEGAIMRENVRRGPRGFRIAIKMKDRDVIERVRSLIGDAYCVSTEAPRAFDPGRPNTHTWSTTYKIELHGDRARWLAGLIYPYMGERRAAKIMDLAERNA
jgi:hypothetical protein